MMIKNHEREEHDGKISKMSKYFQILLKIGLIPLKQDLTGKKLTFKMLSRPTAIFFFYYFILNILMIFSCYYIWGYENWYKSMIKMYEINVTDFLTFFVIVVFNMISYLQFRAFNDITKISSELVLSKNLRWPQNGTLLVCTSILYTFSVAIAT